KRWFGPGAGLLAGAVMALTPAAVLMFRFNNPDALLVLLLTAGAYGITRAIESGSRRWLIVAFVLVGVGFITKELQAFLVVPAFGLAYLLCAPPRFWRRVGDLAWAGVALVVSSGWWVAAVQLTPAADRPYIGGSQDNNLLNLIFGYNGFGRLTGNETGSVGGGGTGTSMWGATGLVRMFNAEFGTQASWMLPAALILLVGGIAMTVRAARTDRSRAALIIWGGWLVVTTLAFSLGQGIIHQYYTVALAPALGAVVAIGAAMLWTRRHHPAARVTAAVAVVATSLWSYELLRRTPTWHPWLGPVTLAAGAVGAGGILLWPLLGTDRTRAGIPRHRKAIVGLAIGGAAAAAAFIGPAAYALETAGTPQAGSIPTAGPAGASVQGGPGGPSGGFNPGRAGPSGAGRPGGPGGAAGGGFGGPGLGGTSTGAGTGTTARPSFAGGTLGRTRGGFGGPAGGAGGAGGLLNASTPSAALTKALEANAGSYKWVAATVGSNSASGYQLATGDPVMALGGFNGTDPYPTLAEFEATVAKGQVHYFIPGGGGGPGGVTNNYSSAITSWVESHFKSETIGGSTVYKLIEPTSSTASGT
ncbi:MAG TPA: glycosyltransferase family 39 protein, partial [Acidimicrobiales bacterium]|nr:glycosyltransferase family 39 protein [Acidimicrobiales bacterium]